MSQYLLKFITERVVQNILSIAALGALFYIIAGRLNILGFWIYAVTALVYQVVSLLFIVPRHPEYIELAQARKAKRDNVKNWDKVVVLFVMGASLLTYGLAALDVGRVHISPLPMVFALAGIIFYIAGSALNQWAMVNNPHFEKGVRIQTDRDHQVITVGPYNYVRHPGYLGSVLGFVSFPFIVGSAVALAGSALCILGMVVRTNLEDNTLHQELPGYTEYANIVRYRLIPYLW